MLAADEPEDAWGSPWETLQAAWDGHDAPTRVSAWEAVPEERWWPRRTAPELEVSSRAHSLPAHSAHSRTSLPCPLSARCIL